MFANQYEEHIAHSASCNSRYDGFDRGTVWANEETITEICIGRMTNEKGQKVSIMEADYGYDKAFTVYVDGNCVFVDFDCRSQAISVARWWMNGCPA